MSTFEVCVLGRGDEALVLDAVTDVFDHAPQAALVAEFLRDDRHHLVGALEDGRLIGFVSAVHYVHPDKPAELWIDEVGVALTPGSAAGVLVYENAWAAPFATALRKGGGQLVAGGRIPIPAIIAALDAAETA